MHVESLIQSSRAYFDDHSDFWEDVYEKDDVFARIHRRREATALDWLSRDDRPYQGPILEFGCGAGRLTAELTLHGPVVAIDTSAQMLQRARRRVPSPKACFLQADASNLPLAAGSVGLVAGLGVLPWVLDEAAVLSEVGRVLVPGGQATMNVDNRWRLASVVDPLRSPFTAPTRRVIRRWLGSTPRTVGPRVTMTTAAAFERALHSAGLRVVARRWIGFGPVTVFGRAVVPHRLACRLDAALQSRADSGGSVRHLASQYLVLCVRTDGEVDR